MPSNQKVTFENVAGESLAAALTLPEQPPRAYALFAHCFTCGKDIATAARIARSLAAHRIAVLRFDFTGLGGSEGDFASTNFSSNIEDLVAAADYLRAEHEAPALMIGHSLGGTAVLAAAGSVEECRAVVTIGAPATPEHVQKQFSANREQLEAKDEATVTLAGREFRIKQQFLDDLRRHPMTERVAELRRALLIFHAPFDDIVSVEEAGRIFQAAKHPKSFISLDGADHLLSKADDAQYVADTIDSWSRRYLPEDREATTEVAGGDVLVAELNKKFLRQVSSDDHAWLADEPKKVGGSNLGPDPYEHLLAALGTCTSMTVRMYANRKQWPLDDIDVRLTHSREHHKDCEDCDEKPTRLEVLRREIALHGDLDDDQRARLLEIADRCPVHRTLESDLRIETRSRTP